MGMTVDEFLLDRGVVDEPTSEDFGADFIAHYGKKGMKWGVTKGDRAGTAVTGKEFRQVTKAVTKEHIENERATFKAKSGKEKAKIISLDLATGGGYSASNLAKAAGYSRGRRTAITLLGGYGAQIVRQQQISDDVRRRIES